jgi:hypothetical protein
MARFRSSVLRGELGRSPLSLHEGHRSISVMSVCRDVSGIGIHVRKPPAVFLFVGGALTQIASFRGQTSSQQATEDAAQPNNLQKADQTQCAFKCTAEAPRPIVSTIELDQSQLTVGPLAIRISRYDGQIDHAVGFQKCLVRHPVQIQRSKKKALKP